MVRLNEPLNMHKEENCEKLKWVRETLEASLCRRKSLMRSFVKPVAQALGSCSIFL